MKEYRLLRDMMRQFFAIVTGIFLGTATFLTVFSIEVVNSSLLWQVFLVALVTALAGFIYCSRRELSKKAFLTRQALHFLAIITILLIAAYLFGWISFADTRLVVVFLVFVVLVYALVSVFIYTAGQKQIKRLNEKLSEYQQQRDDIDA